jgi:signal transduction histidine kinase
VAGAATALVLGAAFAGLVVAAQLAVLASIGTSLDGQAGAVLVRSGVAGLAVAAVAVPVSARLRAGMGRLLAPRGRPAAGAVLETFGARMTRAVPMDELLLQLAESLRSTIGPAGAEVWVGTDGALTRAVSVPERPAARLVLPERERTVAGRTRVVGNAWLTMWAPDVLAEIGGPEGHAVRVAPVAHLGAVLGLLAVRRPPADGGFTTRDEAVLVDLARQVGLALHNVNLDTALQASLRDLRASNDELVASRARVVAAGDAARRRIERDLHDGAQQHLIALAMKLGLARRSVTGDPDETTRLLDELRTDVRAVGAELTDLAHGIYPPLLREHGLGEALRVVAARLPLPCSVEIRVTARHPEAVETAVYFCCLEAMQNAAKHAGDGATLAVRVDGDEAGLRFAVADDGAGFEPASARDAGSGLVNMTDRLGAIGGRLDVTSAPGRGTELRGTVGVRPS